MAACTLTILPHHAQHIRQKDLEVFMPVRRHGEVKRIDGKRVASPEYRAWQAARNRCLNEDSHDYPYYGGRGITFAKRWNLFENFLADMGRRPSPLHTLDRRNNNRGYSKSNCHWVTRREQARNRRESFHTCSMEKADKIRALYASGAYYQYELGEMFGLTQAHISQITRNVCWARD